MRTEILLITPSIAKTYLSKNIGNRKINPKIVAFYADQMSRNLWKLTGQGLSFDSDGYLLDGQHRLSAIIKSNMAIKMLCVFDVERDSFKVYDTGKIRNGVDVFNIEGIANYTNTSSAIYRYLALNANENIFKKGRAESFITTTDQLNEYNSDAELWNEIVLFSQRCYSKMRLYSQSLVGGVIAYLLKNKRYEKQFIYQFFMELFEIENSRPTIKNLRDTLIKDALSTKSYDTKTKFIFLKKAWNNYVLNKEIKLYKIQPDEKIVEFL